MGILVFPILTLPPTSLPIPFLWVIPVHQPWAPYICISTLDWRFPFLLTSLCITGSSLIPSLEPIRKDQHSILRHTYGILKDGDDNPMCRTEKQTQMYRTDFQTLWEKARVGCCERTALKQVYYQGWNRPPAQAGCMRQVLGAGALGRPRGMGWRGRWEGGSGWGTHVDPWLIHVSAWQKPLRYCN